MRRLLPDGPAEVDDLWPLYALPARPHLRVGFVLSVDGAVAVEGSSRPLSGPADRAVFRVLRAVSDVVLVGAGTARDEDYGPVRLLPDLVTRRRAEARTDDPVLAVVSRTLQFDPAGRLLSSGGGGPVLLLAPRSARAPDGLPPHVQVVRCGDDDVDLAQALEALHERGLPRVLCEGGPTLLQALLAEGLVDELCLTTSPQLAGGSPGLLPRPASADLVLEQLLEDEGVLMARWSVRRPGRPLSRPPG